MKIHQLLLIACTTFTTAIKPDADSDARAAVPGSWKNSCSNAHYNNGILSATCNAACCGIQKQSSILVKKGENIMNCDGNLQHEGSQCHIYPCDC